MENTFQNNLSKIINELETSKSFSREYLYEDCIKQKLKNTITTYDKEVDLTTEYLLQRASEKVLKSLSKIQKQKDKEVLNQYLNNNK